jgi:hypothetical protein
MSLINKRKEELYAETVISFYSCDDGTHVDDAECTHDRFSFCEIRWEGFLPDNRPHKSDHQFTAPTNLTEATVAPRSSVTTATERGDP